MQREPAHSQSRRDRQRLPMQAAAPGGMLHPPSFLPPNVAGLSPAMMALSELDAPSNRTTQPDAGLVPFWRPGMMDPSYKSGGPLDFELNDILSGSGSGPTGSTRDVSSGNPTPGPNANEAPDVQMPDAAFAFSSYPSSGGTAAPMAMVMPPRNVFRTPDAGRVPGSASAMDSGPGSGAGSTSPSPSPVLPVAAATGAPDAMDFSRFADSEEAPDLTQHKIEQKNEKCQYHNCPNRARVMQAYGKFCNRHVIVAPCGYPGCRDKAMANANMCEKHLAEGTEPLRRILANRAQNVPVCRTYGCFKNDQGRGYCRGHEKLLMATGRLPKHINKRRLNSAYTMCSYPDCGKHSQRNHLCRTHGNFIMKQAEEMAKTSTTETYEDILARLQKDIRRCTHPTCTKNSQRDRLCTMHYYEKHNLQRDGTPKSGSGPGIGTIDGAISTTVCAAPGCTSHATTRGYCKFHSGADKPRGDNSRDGDGRVPVCRFTGCNNPAPYASGYCAHHGNKVNQAMQLQRFMSATAAGPIVTCSVTNCGAPAMAGANVCEHHRRGFCANPDTTPGMRSSLEIHSAAFYPNATGGQMVSSETNAGMLDRYGANAAAVRMPAQASSVPSAAESDARQALVRLNNSKQSASFGGAGAGATTTCMNPGCTRETAFGRDCCEPCQNLFSPLVVSIGGDASGANNYSFNLSSGGPEITNSESMWSEPHASAATPTGCRVKQCNSAVACAGLCATHFREFQKGALKIDEIALPSRQPTETTEEQVADFTESKRAGTSPKIKKYFCKVACCDKQAQKQGFCKRHFRIQQDQRQANDHDMRAQSHASLDESSCRFPGCAERVGSETTLCPTHANATLCWQAGCTHAVIGPSFCDNHQARRECAFPGCDFLLLLRDVNACPMHAHERRCCHPHCEKFVTSGASGRCRLHLQDCMQQPCMLCELYGHNGGMMSITMGRGKRTSSTGNAGAIEASAAMPVE